MLVQPALEDRLGCQVFQPFQNHGSADEAGEHHGGGEGLHEQHRAEDQLEKAQHKGGNPQAGTDSL